MPGADAQGRAASSSAEAPGHHQPPLTLLRGLQMRAQLAGDEASTSSSSGGRSRNRFQPKGEQDAVETARSAQQIAQDEDVRVVFAKIVGGLTKDGHKAKAQRILMDALQLMHTHLKKGSLEDIK